MMTSSVIINSTIKSFNMCFAWQRMFTDKVIREQIKFGRDIRKCAVN